MTAQGNQLATWRARLFTAAWVLYAGFYICRKNMEGVVAMGPAHLAAELACFGAAYALAQFVGGELADRYNARYTVLAGAVISILCTVSLAWAPAGAVLFLQFGNGFGQGFGWPALLKLFGVWFRNKERDRILGWWSTSYILGGFIATSLTTWLMVHSRFATGVGFHPAFMVASAVLLITALFFAQQTADLPASRPEKQAAGIGGRDSIRGWRSILGNRNMQIIGAMYFFLKMTRYTLLFWLPHYLVSSVGYSAEAAAHTASCFEILSIAGPIAIGYIVERWFTDRRMELGAGMQYALAFICLLHPLLAGSGWFGMIVSISLMGALIHGADLLMSGMTVLHMIPSAQHGRAVGFVNGIGSVGQAISPLLATLFVSYFGWSKLFDLFVFFALLSGVICTFGARLQTRTAPALNRSVLEPFDVRL